MASELTYIQRMVPKTEAVVPEVLTLYTRCPHSSFQEHHVLSAINFPGLISK